METNKYTVIKTRNRFLVTIALALTVPVTLIILLSMSFAGGRSAAPMPEGPCDIYAAAGFPCVTAHSSTRALLSSYNGPLYQVMRQSDGKTLDIGVVKATPGDPGGYADAAAQDAFCVNTLCWITTLYDQSGNGNHLVQAPPGTFRGPAKGGFNTLPIADMAPITIMGHKAYGVYIIPGMGLRNNNAAGLAINDEPQGIYMVFDGKHFDSGCCFNYGNTSTNSRAVGRGTMETVYFGTATAWGSGSGPGPWIMSDMEAGLFSGYNAKQNTGNPTIDSWRFVTGVVNGGGGNKWEIWGGNAQEGRLATFYKGARPGSNENNFYYPMHRKGAVQLGNGGDNGNGSAGTFYEGVMTRGYPTNDAINAVQSNIVAARYDVERIRASRLTTFTPGSSQEITHTFTNTTGSRVTDVTLSIIVPKGWKARVSGSGSAKKTFSGPVEPGESVNASFAVTSASLTSADYLTCKADWKNQETGQKSSETTSQRIRNSFPVKINEVRLSTGASPTDQFIELYNSGNTEVDLSGWTLINTQAGWAPVKLAVLPSGIRLPAGGFYLLGLSASGLAAPASRGESTINVRSVDGFREGQQIEIEGEKRTIAKVGTAATPMTTIFVPVSIFQYPGSKHCRL
ncbi:MAG: lamin tail domain-containing protein [Bacteroidales bacterium]|nr:lamin tail domain-containing protein [Bacteroidales bacterium]